MLRAQSCGSGYTQVTGTYSPYANGSVSAGFINQSSLPQLPLLNGSVFAQFNNTNFDSSGVMGFCLADNNQINPTPSQWKITACQHGGGGPGCCTETVTVTGSTEDISTFLATCPFLAPQAVDPTAVHTNTTSTQTLHGPLNGTSAAFTGAINGGSASFTGALAAGCSQIFADGDTRCYTGSNLGQRITACLNTLPLSGICDASSDFLSSTISAPINVPSNATVILPCEDIATTVNFPFILTNTANTHVIGKCPVLGTNLVPTVHGAQFDLVNDNQYTEIAGIDFNYGTVTGGVHSTNSDDKAIVFTTNNNSSPRTLSFHDLFCEYSYDCIFDSNYIGSAYTTTGTNSNVVQVTNVTAWHAGNSVVTHKDGIGDQWTLIHDGCDGFAALSTLSCIYFGTTNNIITLNTWAWHGNDAGNGDGGAPNNYSAMRFDASSALIYSPDFEANHPAGNSPMLFLNDGTYNIELMTTFGNVYGGGGTVGPNYQELIQTANGTVTHLGTIQQNGGDTCSATLTTYDNVFRDDGTVNMNGVLAHLHAMPGGTNCTPNVSIAGATSPNLVDAEAALQRDQHTYFQWIQTGPGTGNGYVAFGPYPNDPTGNVSATYYAEGQGGFWVVGGIAIEQGSTVHYFKCANLTGTPPNLGTPTSCVDYQPKQLLEGDSPSIGGSPLSAGTCATATFTITGADPSTMAAIVSPNNYPGDAFRWNAFVSASNTVKVDVCTDLAAGGTPTASTYHVRVIP